MLKHPCGTRKNKDAKKDELLSLTKEDLKIKLTKIRKNMGMSVTNIPKLNRSQLCVAVSPIFTINVKNTMPYDGSNSCFIDSALVALFHFYNIWATKHIWSCNMNNIHRPFPIVQVLAKRIKVSLENMMFPNDLEEKKVTKKQRIADKGELRKLFTEFDEEYQNAYGTNIGGDVEWESSMNDPIEVLNLFYRVFQIPDDIKIQYGRAKPIKGTIMSPVIYAHDLKNMGDDIKLWDHIPSNDEYKILGASILYVNIQRNYNQEYKIRSKVEPPEYIKLGGKMLKLMSIIIHKGGVNGGHYKCVIRHNEANTNMWLHFDDMSPKLNFAGHTLREALTADVLSNLVGLVYSI